MNIFKVISKILKSMTKVFALIALVNLAFSYIEQFVHRERPEGGRYYVWKHGKIFYHKRGKGSPVILLHGFDPARSGKDVVSLSKHLSTNHTVYSIDLLGFGLSDKPWIKYTNYLYVLMIQDFIKEIIGDITDIVAVEESGLCVLQALKLDPTMIGKVVLVKPCYCEKVFRPSPYSLFLKKLIDCPIIGTFLYNLYSLTDAAPFDKEGRHVFTSRIVGYLTSDLTGHDDLISDEVVVLNPSSSEVLTLGDIKTALM